MFQPASSMTVNTAKAIYEAGLAAIRGGQASIDLSALTAVDSSAVAALVGWRRAAVQQGIALEFANIPPSLHSLAELYGVAELLAADSSRIPATDLPGNALPHH